MPSVDFQKLFDLNRLFSRYIPATFAFQKILLYIFGGIVLVAGVTWLAVAIGTRDKTKRIAQRQIASMAKGYLTVSMIGLFLLLCRMQKIPLFAMRIWLFIIILMLIGMIGYYGYLWLVEYPASQAAYTRELIKQQYLPKPKKKK
jgi:NADH:ubiquinone oxidoreductase subunit 5 (subunit L)/multisubunit Na+/H+ antiporter MnhA subunit